jgi:hypothetical protein
VAKDISRRAAIPSLAILNHTTVDPVYSKQGYSQYPLIVNGFLRTDR